MIDVQAYIESGVIESYCLGNATPEEEKKMFDLCKQYPAIKSHFDSCQKAFEVYLQSFEKKIPPSKKDNILQNILGSIEADTVELTSDGQFSEFIDISNSANFQKLEELIKNLQPLDDFESVHIVNLFSKGGKELNLVWVKDLVPMEEHPHLDESFLVLEGTADCNIDGVITHMARGDFMRIPPESNHEVVITSSSPAKAIQSRITLY